MNNTHTGGLLKDSRKAMGINNIRSGLSTPTGNAANILEKSLRGNTSQLEESKISQ